MVKINKKFDEMKENYIHYGEVKSELITNAKNIFGKDILSDVFLPDNFDFSKQNQDYFQQRDYQSIAIPYTDEQFKSFVSSPKKCVSFGNPIYNFNNEGKQVQAFYMFGKDKENKNILFAFSIVKDRKIKNKFSIKLDFCPQGKNWINLIRLDANGASHLNYFNGNCMVENESQAERCDTPHIHFNSEMTQVVCNKNLEYMPAVNLSKYFKNGDSFTDETLFNDCLKYVIELSNIDVKLSKINDNEFNRDYLPYLFDFNSFNFIDSQTNLKEL